MLANETAAIVRIYGEIDRKVNVDARRRVDVAQFLWPYLEEPTLHWYRDYQEWVGETPEEDDNAFPVVEPALRQLAENNRPRPRERARRMFAIAVLTRAFPEMKNEGNELREAAISALGALPGLSEREGAAEQLYGVLAGEHERPSGAEAGGEAGPEPIPGTHAWWEWVVAAFGGDTNGMYPRPCTGRWVRVPGIKGPVDALRTEYEPEGIDITDAANLLTPENWPICSDFWCRMVPLGDPAPGERRYHEVVSVHCDDPAAPGFWAETDLLFNFMWIPEQNGAAAAVANYRLVPERPYENDLIVLDEGTLVVAVVTGTAKLLVTTTKRIRFSRDFLPGAIAVMACAWGYGDISNDLLACTAALGARGTPFPGVAVNTAPAPNGGGAAPHAGPGQAPAGGCVQEGADIAIRAIREGATLLERHGAAGLQSSLKRPRGRGG